MHSTSFIILIILSICIPLDLNPGFRMRNKGVELSDMVRYGRVIRWGDYEEDI
jgi:hypothetical protein